MQVQTLRTTFPLLSSLLLLAGAGWVLLSLGGCFSLPQVYSTSQHQAVSLQAGDLEQGGLALITPSAAFGQEEDKQALAFGFADAFEHRRPQVPCIRLAETLGIINRAGLAQQYREMLSEYRESGVFSAATLGAIGEASRARYIGHLQLAAVSQNYERRLSVFGFRIFGTKYTNMRMYLQIWDSRDGTIAWEGGQEVNYAVDAMSEKKIPFKDLVESTAEKLIDVIP